MELKTSRNKTYEVEMAVMAESTGRLTVRLRDKRALSAVARDFDGIASVKVKRIDGWTEHAGPFALMAINRYQNDDRIAISMTREA